MSVAHPKRTAELDATMSIKTRETHIFPLMNEDEREGRALYASALRARCERRYKEAGDLLRQAGQYDCPGALWELFAALHGIPFVCGGGCMLTRDPEEAEYFLLRGADAGDARCQMMAHILLEDPYPERTSAQSLALRMVYDINQTYPACTDALVTALREECATAGDDPWPHFALALALRSQTPGLVSVYSIPMEQAARRGLVMAQWMLFSEPPGLDRFEWGLEAVRQGCTHAAYALVVAHSAHAPVGPSIMGMALYTLLTGTSHGNGDMAERRIVENTALWDAETLERVKFYVGLHLAQNGGGGPASDSRAEHACWKVYLEYRKRARQGAVAFLGCVKRRPTWSVCRDMRTKVGRLIGDPVKWLP